MSKIIQLPQEIISKIAAGEVIERPAFAVKELIENAIDAKADYIRVDIEKSGLQKIMVTDNGEGMNKNDLQLSFLPYTTSKLHTEEDLHSIKSMGFRGEALSSIASISNLTIKSKTKDELAGMTIQLEGNTVISTSPVGISQGTAIRIENLFATIPARKKFLKSLQTEYRQIIQVILSIAMAYPDIHFFVTNNQQTVLDLPKQTLTDRIISILGKATVENLIPISGENSYGKVNGFISKPQLSQTTQNKSYLIVNKRVIKDPAISKVIRNAYGTLLPPQLQPIFILFIKLPNEMIDVNVHPRKEEVHFHDSALIHETISNAVTTSLQSHNLTFQDKRWNKSAEKNSLLENFTVREGNTSTYAADFLRDKIVPYTIKNEALQWDEMVQINNLYILIQTTKGMVLIDQHAAHERILYEQLMTTFKKEKGITHQHELDKTILIDFGTIEKQVLNDNENLFSQLGFDINHFAGNTFKVNAIPELFKDRNIEELLREMIEDIGEFNSPKEVDTRSQRMLTYIACRSALKAGDTLTKAQMKEVVTSLQQTNNNATCPHGRPTQITMTFEELNKLFHR